jgi:hypothetical protein
VADNLFVVQFNSVKLLKSNTAIILGGVKLRSETELAELMVIEASAIRRLVDLVQQD